MTKTKKQLRAEAVERLMECRYHTLSDYVRAMLGWGHEPHFEDSRDALIDLLTDDDANDDSTPEKVVSGSEPCVTSESCRQYADQRKQGDDADCENCDSREKLEADIRNNIAVRITPSRNKDGVLAPIDEVFEWLDRQAAITEREHPGLTVSDDESLINWRGRNYLTQSRVLNAERERDEFSLKLKHEMELNRDNRNAHDLERITELTAERDKLQEQLLIGWECECRLQAERERYREKFGKCIDYADAIHALMDDEGMA